MYIIITDAIMKNKRVIAKVVFIEITNGTRKKSFPPFILK